MMRSSLSAREQVRNWKHGLLLIVGTGASLLSAEPNLLVYADMARWEIQQRQRRNAIGNLGADNLQESPGQKYKRAFFVDWRAADHLKKSLLPKIDFWLDTNGDVPKLVTGRAVRDGLDRLPVVPFGWFPISIQGRGAAIGWRRFVAFPLGCRIMPGVSTVYPKKTVCCSLSEGHASKFQP